jgi:broad specificity phosphatase PhoE
MRYYLLRHSIATRPAQNGDLNDDLVRQLTPAGIALAQAVRDDLAKIKFDLAISTRVPRTDATLDILVEAQTNLVDIISRRWLFLPLDNAEAKEMFDAYVLAANAQELKDDPRILPEMREIARSIECETMPEFSGIEGLEEVLVVHHNGLIQLIAYCLSGDHLDEVLNVNLGPCDGIILDIPDDENKEPSFTVYRAPKTAQTVT